MGCIVLVRCVLVLRCGLASACIRIPHHPNQHFEEKSNPPLNSRVQFSHYTSPKLWCSAAKILVHDITIPQTATLKTQATRYPHYYYRSRFWYPWLCTCPTNLKKAKTTNERPLPKLVIKVRQTGARNQGRSLRWLLDKWGRSESANGTT